MCFVSYIFSSLTSEETFVIATWQRDSVTFTIFGKPIASYFFSLFQNMFLNEEFIHLKKSAEYSIQVKVFISVQMKLNKTSNLDLDLSTLRSSSCGLILDSNTSEATSFPTIFCNRIRLSHCYDVGFTRWLSVQMKDYAEKKREFVERVCLHCQWVNSLNVFAFREQILTIKKENK